MKIKNLILAFSAVLCVFSSCSEDLGSSDIIVPEFDYSKLSDTDRYIYDNFTVLYNMEIKYHWNMGDQSSDDMRKDLVPPKVSKVVPFLKAIKAMWIDTYVEETKVTNPTFLKTYIPKVMLLNGCPSYNDDGTTTEGTAEGGRQIVMYSINDFAGKRSELLSYAHVMHHEFSHILHQTVLYNERFKQITPGYSSNWNQISDATARSRGFITAYASSKADEDFAEMVSQLITHKRADWDAMIEGAGNETAVANLREKESIVVGYMQDTWKIDIYSLQDRVMTTIDNLSK